MQDYRTVISIPWRTTFWGEIIDSFSFGLLLFKIKDGFNYALFFFFLVSQIRCAACLLEGFFSFNGAFNLCVVFTDNTEVVAFILL